MKIIDYKIIYISYSSDLSKLVREELLAGWCVYGNPYLDNDDYHYQAMVKYEEQYTPDKWMCAYCGEKIEAIPVAHECEEDKVIV